MKKLKGITLAELIASLAITLTVLLLVGTVIVTGIKVMYENAEITAARTVGDSVYAFISNKLTFSDRIALNDEENTGNCICVSDDFGHLLYNSEDIFGEEFYSGFLISIDCSAQGRDLIELQINVVDNDDVQKQRYCARGLIKCLNADSLTFSDTAKQFKMYLG